MDLSFLANHHMLIVLLGCLVLGIILKKWVLDEGDKFIPTILALIGALLCMSLNSFSIENAIYGAIAGLSSTGLHQAFKQLSDDEQGNVIKQIIALLSK